MAQSKQLVKYVKHELMKRGKSDYVLLVYNRLDSEDTSKEHKTGNFIAKLDDESKELIKKKGTFVITKTQEGDFWNLTKVEPESTYKKQEKKSYNGGGKSSTGYQAKSYNEAGVKVGAVLHDAVALAGQGADVSKVQEIAEKLLYLRYELENNVNAGKYKSSLFGSDVPDLDPAEPELSDDDINF